MKWNSSRCIINTASAAFKFRVGPTILSGLLLLTFCGQLSASIGRPAFQGAAAPRMGGGGSSTLGFDIALNFNDVPTAGELAAFQAAEATWESIIKGYRIDDIFSTTVIINVDLNPIDGPSGILGGAGPTFAKINAAQNAVTSTFLYTDEGDMEFDTADTPGLITLGLFDEVILHEMGHVLGIGTLWSSSAVGFPGRQELYLTSGRYTGAAGLAAYNAEFNPTALWVPVELGGGGGTAHSHWDEVNNGAGFTGIVSNIEPGPFNDMRYEIMTGWLNSPQAFLSSLTSQSMIDLGYVVVPEPTSLGLGSIGLICLARRRRQR
jgi:hypothetical protein